MENVLELTHLKKYYGQTRAVEDVSFSVKPGEVVVIIGPSGAGKSTVLRCINRMIDPTEGSIVFQGTDMAKVKREKELKAIRRRIGMIFQSFITWCTGFPCFKTCFTAGWDTCPPPMP